MEKIAIDELRRVMRYEPETGLLWWRVPRRKVRLDQPAGSVRSDGRRVVRIDGVLYLATHLAWVLMTGAWPTALIDHRDRDPSNDRWDNLREASPSDNMANQGASSRNRLRVRGITKISSGYRVRVTRNRRSKHYGVFATLEEATAVCAAASVVTHGEFAATMGGSHYRLIQ